MTVPQIPERTREEAINDILESIALEETALAHLINAEAEKVQSEAAQMARGTVSQDQVIDFQKSVVLVLQNIIKKEMLLQFKLESILELEIISPY